MADRFDSCIEGDASPGDVEALVVERVKECKAAQQASHFEMEGPRAGLGIEGNFQNPVRIRVRNGVSIPGSEVDLAEIVGLKRCRQRDGSRAGRSSGIGAPRFKGHSNRNAWIRMKNDPCLRNPGPYQAGLDIGVEILCEKERLR